MFCTFSKEQLVRGKISLENISELRFFCSFGFDEVLQLRIFKYENILKNNTLLALIITQE